MRPVRLELRGFANFRGQQVVDFDGADYFALVGPTGAGKSTVLDAITFALYGTAYRWGRSNSVSYALAPTSNEASVALTFDVDDKRYQVARQVRRVGSAGTPQQKEASLVEFDDPTVNVLTADGTDKVVAYGPGEVRAAVEALTGLEFGQFCQCVVLPQGAFARFLTSTSTDRTTILLKLLDAHEHEGIAKHADAEQRDAKAKATAYDERLGQLGDVTEATVAATEAAADAAEKADATLNDLHQQAMNAQLRRDAAQRDLVRLQRAVELVDRFTDATSETLLSVPPEQVQQREAEANQRLADARAARKSADEAATKAREDLEAAPTLERIDQWRREHAEVAALTGKHDPARQAAAAAAAKVGDSDTAVRAAREEERRAAKAVQRGEQAERDAEASVRELQTRVQTLAAVTAPDGLDAIATNAAAVVAQERDASQAAERARRNLAAAQEAADQATTDETLKELDTLLARLDATSQALSEAKKLKEHADLDVERLKSEYDTAQQTTRDASVRLERAKTTAGAAALRPTLTVGGECPVCTQEVVTIPPPAETPDLEKATEEHQEAVGAEAAAMRAWQEGRDAAGKAVAQVDLAAGQVADTDARLAVVLPGQPVGDDRDRDADQVAVEGLRTGATTARTGLTEARSAVTAADLAVDAAVQARSSHTESVVKVRTQLHAALGRVAALDPPDATGAGDVTAAWKELTAWAAEQSRVTQLDLEKMADTATHLAAKTRQAHETHDGHRRRLEELTTEHTQLTGTQARADAAVEQIEASLARLAAALADAPGSEALDDLEQKTRDLHAATTRAYESQAAAGRAVSAAENEACAAADAASGARRRLNDARDGVAVLEPPALAGDSLAADADAFLAWVATAGADASGALATARAQDVEATETIRSTSAAAGALLEQVNVPAPDGLGDPDRPADALISTAHRAVTGAAARRRTDASTAKDCLAEAAALREKTKAERERAHVAAEVVRLMRSNRFPQWIADSALDLLVDDASEKLHALSDGQYDLTHKDGDFFVIDHADADSERAVRTLSGGETFQASLALALALSEQIAAMGGGSKLESIFLDEGFGTLDGDALDKVAATLENLSQDNRMVGVITHVGALADRIPVRFQVSSDNRGSHIIRTGLVDDLDAP